MPASPNSIDIIDEIRKNRSNCTALLKKLEKASNEDVQQVNKSTGMTPLHYVMIFCKGPSILNLVKFLVRRDPSCIASKTNRDTLAINCMPPTTNPQNVIDEMQRDQLQARLYLMKKYPQGVNMEDMDGETPLIRAIIGRCNLLVEKITENFPDTVFQKSSKIQKLPLHYAMETTNDTALKLLYQKYPQGILEKDRSGKTPADILESSHHKQKLIAAMAQVIMQVFEIESQMDHMIPQFLNESNRTIWTRKVLLTIIQNSSCKPKQTEQENISPMLPPPTPKRLLASPEQHEPPTQSRKPETPLNFSRYTKKGQFQALRQSFESPSRGPRKITSP